MSDTSTTPEAGATPEATATVTEPAPEAPLEDAGKRALDKERSARRDAEKANKAIQSELDALRRESMSDQEKAVDAAKAEARLSTIGELGGKLAAAEIKAAAAGRLDADQLVTLIDGLNLASFLGDDGEVDAAKVSKFVDGIAPARPEAAEPDAVSQVFDLGQGARDAQSNALNGDPLLRDLKAKLGVR